MHKPLRIVLADDQALVRHSLRYIIDAQSDMSIVGEAIDGIQAIEVTTRTRPDLVLMDIRMPGGDGLEATRTILATLPATRVVLLTTFDMHEYVFAGIRAGAVGYLLKDAETQILLDGIRAAAQGAVVYRSATSAQALAQVMRAGIGVTGDAEHALLEPLTEREQAILQHMAQGQRNAEIALVLGVSEGTVKTHVHHILQKLGVADRTQAVVKAIRQHLVQ